MPSVHDAKRTASREYLTGRRQPLRAGWSYLVSADPAHNLVGIGVGPKLRNEKRTTQLAVRFYVVRKLNLNRVSSEFQLPGEIDGVPTDVIETGLLLPACTPEPGAIDLVFRPVRPGCSITAGQGEGTFGAVVEQNGKTYLLTNNHVLANNDTAAIGLPVHQPGVSDSEGSRIGQVSTFVPIGDSGSTRVDAALANLETPANPMPLRNVGPLASQTPVAARSDMTVEKVGRKTGHTCGIVRDVAFDFSCPYSFGTVLMEDQILIEGTGSHFAKSGDSGSLVVDSGTKRATGLLYAVSFSEGTLFSVANHIGDVLSELSVRLVI